MAQGGDRQLLRRVAGQEDHLQVGLLAAQGVEHGQPVHARHLVVRDDRVEAAAVGEGDRLRAARRGLGVVAGAHEPLAQRVADVGLVGFPNAGKSSLTNLITKARPKVAAYPFTTLQPQIGVIEYPEEYDRIVLADVPGLIAGASENKGLGHRFLRHIERCKILLIILDLAGTDNRDPRDDYKQLLKELELYDEALLDKPRLIAANKMDEDAAVENLKKFKKRYPKVELVPISCLSEEGIPKLRKELLKRVKKLRPKAKKPKSKA